MKKYNKRNAIISFVFAFVFAGIGVYAYLNDYYILLFRIIPLNAPAFGVIAILLLVWAIVDLVRAPKKDQAAADAHQAQIIGAQQAAAIATPLASPCTVNVVVSKGRFGPGNRASVTLNGYEVGVIKGKESLSFGTTIDNNELGILQSANGVKTVYRFQAVAGGIVNINLKTNSFSQITVTQG